MWCVTQVKNHTQHEMLMFDTETCCECKAHCAQAHTEEAPFSILKPSEICQLN